MKQLKAFFIASVLLALLIGVYLGSSFTGQNIYVVNDSHFPHGIFDIEIKNSDGSLILQESKVNLITVCGRTHVRNLLCALNATYTTELNITDWLGLSNDAITGGDYSGSGLWEKLPTEVTTNGINRTQGVPTVLNSTAYKVEYTWTRNTDAVTLQTCGIYFGALSGGGNFLYACGNFTSTTLNDGDTLKITYTLNNG